MPHWNVQSDGYCGSKMHKAVAAAAVTAAAVTVAEEEKEMFQTVRKF